MQYVAFDIETTGMYPFTDEIIEVGAIRFASDGMVIAAYSSLLRADRDCTAESFATHGITPDQIAGAPPAVAVIPEFRAFLGKARETTLIAHGARKDLEFVRVACAKVGTVVPSHDVCCTFELARLKWPNFLNHSLPFLAGRFRFPLGVPHRALPDAERTRLLWLELQKG